MRCSCGQIVEDGVPVCPFCGNVLSSEVNENNTNARKQAKNTSVKEFRKKNSFRRITETPDIQRDEPPKEEKPATSYFDYSFHDEDIPDIEDDDPVEPDYGEGVVAETTDDSDTPPDAIDPTSDADDWERHIEDVFSEMEEKPEAKAEEKADNAGYFDSLLEEISEEKDEPELVSAAPVPPPKADSIIRQAVPEDEKKQQTERMEIPGMEYYSNRDGYYDDTEPKEPPADDNLPVGTILKWFAIASAVIGFIVFMVYYTAHVEF